LTFDIEKFNKMLAERREKQGLTAYAFKLKQAQTSQELQASVSKFDDAVKK